MKPRVAVFKFASCDGCQLQLLNAEDELLALSEQVDLAYFPEARSRTRPGPYDIAFVEGSITTPEDARRIIRVREACKALITIGACATAGGIQALRDWADIEEYKRIAYPRPEFVAALSTSTPISEHVKVDFEIWGCPVDREQFLGVIRSILSGAQPALPTHSVCMECKRKGAVCVAVAAGTPCLGPITRAGCGALCPRLHRGCYGCFGPSDDPNMDAYAHLLSRLGIGRDEAVRLLRGINGAVSPLRETSDAIEGTKD